MYHAFPQAAETRLARIHFWLHNLGLPPLMISLAFLLAGNAAFEPIVGICSLVVWSGVILFVVNVWLAVRPAAAPGALRAGTGPSPSNERQANAPTGCGARKTQRTFPSSIARAGQAATGGAGTASRKAAAQAPTALRALTDDRRRSRL